MDFKSRHRGTLALAMVCLTVLIGRALADSSAPPVGTIFDVNPFYGGTSGGTRITITGQGFSDPYLGNSVFIGDDECRVLGYYSSDQQIVCETPPHAPTPGDTSLPLRVYTGKQALARCSTWKCIFRYYENYAPLLEEVFPGSSPSGGSMSFVGRVLESDASQFVHVSIGDYRCAGLSETAEGEDAPVIQLESAYRYHYAWSSGFGRIPCQVPDMPAGYYNASFQSSQFGNSIPSESSYRLAHDRRTLYQVAIHPRIDSISPAHGSVAGGTTVTIMGSGFSSDSNENQVSIDGVPCQIVTAEPNRITCRSQPGSDVSGMISNSFFPGGQGFTRLLYNYTDYPLTSIPMTPLGYGTHDFSGAFETELNFRESYSQHLETLFTPPVTGPFTFYLQCDDTCDLRLAEVQWAGNATTRTRAFRRNGNFTLLASQGQWLPYRDYARLSRPSATSGAVMLNSAKTYMLIGRQSEGIGLDSFSVGAVIPNNETLPISDTEFQTIVIRTAIIRERQLINMTGITSGTFVLYYGTDRTDKLPFNISAADLEYTLNHFNGTPGGFRVARIEPPAGVNSRLWEVTLDFALGNRQRFVVDSFSLRGSPVRVNVTVIQQASAPLGGTFDITLLNRTIRGLALYDYNPIDSALFSVFGDQYGPFASSRWFVQGDSCTLKIQFPPLAGNVGPIFVNLSGLTGLNVSVSVKSDRNGSTNIFEGPLSGIYLRKLQQFPQLTVRTRGLLGVCAGNCSYLYSRALSATIDRIDRSGLALTAGTVISVSGSGFTSLNGAPSTRVLLLSLYSNGSVAEYFECQSQTVINNTHVDCSLPELPAGNYRVAVLVEPYGLARLAAGSNVGRISFHTVLTISSISPSFGSVGGGTHITLAGHSFPNNPHDTLVLIGGELCRVESATSTEIVCRTPSRSSLPSMVSVERVASRATGQSMDFAFDFSVTPRVDSFSPDSIFAADRRAIFHFHGAMLAGPSGPSSVEISIGDIPCVIEHANATDAVCSTGVVPPGIHFVNYYVRNLGSPLFNHSSGYLHQQRVDSRLHISSLFPNSGSFAGGTVLTLTGDGFRSTTSRAEYLPIFRPDDVRVFIGGTVNGADCEILTVTDTQITCRVPAQQPVDPSTLPPAKVIEVDLLVNRVPATCSAPYVPPVSNRTCSLQSSCETCALEDDCAWCASTMRCVNTTTTSCAPREEIIFEVAECVAPVGNCTARSCYTCLSSDDFDCIWCATGPYSGSCMNITSASCTHDVVIDSEECVIPDPSDHPVVVPIFSSAFVERASVVTPTHCGDLNSCSSCLSASFDDCVWCDSSRSCHNVTESLRSSCSAIDLVITGYECPVEPEFPLGCLFQFANLSTPVVTRISPSEGPAGTVLRIQGRWFAEDDHNVRVKLGNHTCTVLSSTRSEIRCRIPDIPGGTHNVQVDIAGYGFAMFDLRVTSPEFLSTLDVLSISPTAGSVGGGTLITLNGFGFDFLHLENNIVRLVNSSSLLAGADDSTPIDLSSPGFFPCTVQSATYGHLTCRTSPLDSFRDFTMPAILVAVVSRSAAEVVSASCSLPGCRFSYSIARTPLLSHAAVVTAASFASSSTDFAASSALVYVDRAKAGDHLVLQCSNTQSAGTLVTVSISGSPCTLRSSDATSIRCQLPTQRAGTHLVHLSVAPWGDAYHTVTASDGSHPLVPRSIQYALSVTHINALPLDASQYMLSLELDSFLDDLRTASVQSAKGFSFESLGAGDRGSVAGGVLLAMAGEGLGAIPADTNVSICNAPCQVLVASPGFDGLICRTGPIHTRAVVEQFGPPPVQRLRSAVFGASFTDFTPSVFCPASFDDNPTTYFSRAYFEGLTDCGGCGYDFGNESVAVVTRIRFYPRGDIATGRNEMVRGQFQGSNDGVHFTPLHTITDLPQSGWNTVDLDLPNWSNATEFSNRAFRYIRYVGPTSMSCSIADVQYYGIVLASSSTGLCSLQINVADSDPFVPASDEFQYDIGRTPVVTSVHPLQGTSAGGTLVTITGTGFSQTGGAATVQFDTVTCAIQSLTSTQITCITGPRQSIMPSQIFIHIANGYGYAHVPVSQTFQYIDRWSDPRTWVDGILPEDGDSVFVERGQSLLIDVPYLPKLYSFMIEGAVRFEDNQDYHLRVSYLFVLGGKLEVGTPEAPFQHRAVITVYGNASSIPLPMYGAKVIGARGGVLDFHGQPKTPSWTHLAATVSAGDDSIVVQDTVNWLVGDEIVISSTQYDPHQAEQRTIINLVPESSSGGGVRLFLDRPIQFEHLGESRWVNTTEGRSFLVHHRAEVGVLTRNVVIQGDESSEATQFGVHVMMNSPDGPDSTIGRFSNVQVRRAGQAFQLGRYPLHFHLIGRVPSSYVVNCSIHRTYNRAVTVHGVHELLIAGNVAYDTRGHTFFIEDGIETQNRFEHNLGILTQQSWSLLNTDQTPATFWITNPSNDFVGNVAAGSTHYGFWYDLKVNPSGPSSTETICPQRMPVGAFDSNHAHSNGRYGLRIFHLMDPRQNPCSANLDPVINPPVPAYLFDFSTYRNNRSGLMATEIGDVHFVNFIATECMNSQFEITNIAVPSMGRTAHLINALAVGHFGEDTAVQDAVTSSSGGQTFGFIAPQSEFLAVQNITFVNFNSTGPVQAYCLSTCSKCFHANTRDQGGYSAYFRGVQYLNSPLKAVFAYPFKDVLVDSDGSLTGGAANRTVSFAWSFNNDTTRCHADEEHWGGRICDPSVRIRRLALVNPAPAGTFRFKRLRVTNLLRNLSGTVEYLTKRTPDDAWVVPVISGDSYEFAWELDVPVALEHIAYVTYNWDPSDYVFVRYQYPFNESLHLFSVVDQSGQIVNETLALDDALIGTTDNFTTLLRSDPYSSPLWTSPFSNPIANLTQASWRFNNETDQFLMLVDGQFTHRRIPFGPSESWFTHYYARLIDIPNVPPPTDGVPENATRYWSNSSTWLNTTWFPAPQEGDEVQIPRSWTLVVDVSPPLLRTLIIEGTVLFSPSVPDIVLTAAHILVRGGRLLAGNATHPHPQRVRVELYGDSSTFPIVVPPALNLGAKVLGIFGEVRLFGQPNGGVVDAGSWVRLAANVSVGATVIDVTPAVPHWAVGAELVIATSSLNWDESERAIVTAIENGGTRVRLDRALTAHHFGQLQTIAGIGETIDMRAEVGVLTRSIVITSSETSENFGCHIYVGQFMDDSVARNNMGLLQLDNVRIHRCGVDTEDTDSKRPAVFVRDISFNNSDPDSLSFIRSSTITESFNTAILLNGTGNIAIQSNVIVDSIGSAVKIVNNYPGVVFEHNLVMRTWFYAPAHPEETQEYASLHFRYLNPNVAISIRGNVAAGSSSMGMILQPLACTGAPVGSRIMNNVIHSCELGVFLMDNPNSVCVMASNLFVYKTTYMGIFSLQRSNVIVDGCLLSDNGIGIGLISGNVGSSNAFTVQNSVIIGQSDNLELNETLTCNRQLIGMFVPAFGTGTKPLPPKVTDLPWHRVKTDPAVYGITNVRNVTFARFRNTATGCVPPTGSSFRDFVVASNPEAADVLHPIRFSEISYSDVDNSSLAYVFDPSFNWRTIDDCGDMDCDGPRHVIMRDVDGSLLFPTLNANSTILSNNPFIAPRNECSLVPEWNAYKCRPLANGAQFQLMVIESRDNDTLDRRIAPVNVTTGSLTVLVNGPMDHRWDQDYTSQKRLSTFFVAVQTGRQYRVSFAATNPRRTTFYLLNGSPSELVLVALPYQSPERVEISVNGTAIPSSATIPSLDNATAGANFFDRPTKTVWFVIGQDALALRQIPMVVVSMRLDVAIANFFADGFLRNMAALLNIDISRLRIASLRSGSTIVDLEVTLPSSGGGSGGGSGSGGDWDPASVEQLRALADVITQRAQNGSLDVGYPLLSLDVSRPTANISDVGNPSDGGGGPIILPGTTTTDDGLSGGAIAGIIVGSIAGVLLASATLMYVSKHNLRHVRVRPRGHNPVNDSDESPTSGKDLDTTPHLEHSQSPTASIVALPVMIPPLMEPLPPIVSAPPTNVPRGPATLDFSDDPLPHHPHSLNRDPSRTVMPCQRSQYEVMIGQNNTANL